MQKLKAAFGTFSAFFKMKKKMFVNQTSKCSLNFDKLSVFSRKVWHVLGIYGAVYSLVYWNPPFVFGPDFFFGIVRV